MIWVVTAERVPEGAWPRRCPVIAGAFGAGIGLAVRTLMHKTTTVYPEAAKRMLIVPVISRDTVDVRASR